MTKEEMFYFVFEDGKQSELMTESTTRMFNKELRRTGLNFEVKKLTLPIALIKKLGNIERFIDALTSENYELKVELKNLKDQFDKHVDPSRNRCPHTSV